MLQILRDICSFLYFTRNILKCYESSFHICNFSITGFLPRREHTARYPASQESTNTLFHNSGVLINSWLIFCSGSLLSQLSPLISKSLCFQRSRGPRAPPPHNRSAPKCLNVSNCLQSSKVSQRKWIKQLQFFFTRFKYHSTSNVDLTLLDTIIQHLPILQLFGSWQGQIFCDTHIALTWSHHLQEEDKLL